MPRVKSIMGRRIGGLGLALTVWDIWLRIPPRQRKILACLLVLPGGVRARWGRHRVLAVHVLPQDPVQLL